MLDLKDELRNVFKLSGREALCPKNCPSKPQRGI